MAHLSTEYAEETSSPLVFPQRQRSRLLISCTTVDPISGNPVTSQAELFDSKVAESELSVDEQLLLAQTELLEQEIFQRLLEDSGKLPSANVRVSERLIEVEATQGVDVKFELVSRWRSWDEKCQFICARHPIGGSSGTNRGKPAGEPSA